MTIEITTAYIGRYIRWTQGRIRVNQGCKRRITV
jgi:hypothetical protein